MLEQKVANNVFEQRIEEITTMVGQKVDNESFENRFREMIRANVNKAISAFGATVTSGISTTKNGGHLFSGGTHEFDWQDGMVSMPYSDLYVVVTWAAPVRLALVGFRLWDLEDRTYTYTFEYKDQLNAWHNVCADRLGKSWQWFILSDSGVMVSALRWKGTNTSNAFFHIVELEAY